MSTFFLHQNVKIFVAFFPNSLCERRKVMLDNFLYFLASLPWLYNGPFKPRGCLLVYQIKPPLPISDNRNLDDRNCAASLLFVLPLFWPPCPPPPSPSGGESRCLHHQFLLILTSPLLFSFSFSSCQIWKILNTPVILIRADMANTYGSISAGRKIGLFYVISFWKVKGWSQAILMTFYLRWLVDA